MPAGVLQCPSCGAAVSDDSTRCQYCTALLQTVACPKCFGMMFKGSNYCPHCGTSAVATQIGAAAAHKCPLCRNQMNLVSIAAATVEECIACAGIWVKAADFNAICANSQSEAAAVSLPAPPAPQPDEPVVRYLKCPVCSEIMNRTNYAHASGVIINTCVGHGIWFDHDALRRVIEFIRGGGLDRARKMDELERAHESAMEQCQRRSVRDWYPFSQGGLPHGEEAFRAIASLIDVAVR